MSMSFWSPSLKEKYGFFFTLTLFYAYVFLQDETVVTLSIMRMTVQDAANPLPYPVLSLAAPRSLVFHLLRKLVHTLT
jgi:hypothetical protein